jgi:AcrR family transcriptional regulator
MLQPGPKAPNPSRSRTGRDSRIEALLDTASQELNVRGVASASLAGIARGLGLTRAALYYYVKDREDLVFQCYRRSCVVMARDLAAAAAEPNDGLGRLLSFTRRALDPDRPPAAVLSELDYLRGEARAQIAAAHAENVAALRAIIRMGIADGSLRACDDEIIAQTLIGLVAWAPLSVAWVEATDATFRARTVNALDDLIRHGQASDPAYRFVPPVRIGAFRPAPPKPFDRAAVAEAKIDELLLTASDLFNRRGVDGVSLDDITGALGATKGALYHYLENKTDLVVRCYRRAYDLYERFADAAEASTGSGLEAALIGHYLNIQAHTAGLSPLIQLAGAEALPTKAGREIRRRSRALQRRFEAFGRRGLADGSNRPMDFDAISQLGAGSFQWLPKWIDRSDPRTADTIAEEILGLFVHGLRPRQEAP